MSFEKICRDIKNLKIQGAENIAIAGLKAISLKRDKKSVKKLLNLRETEPLLRNSVKFVLKDYGRNYGIAMDHLKNVRKKIAEIGYKKFKGKKVFTHCHSSTVVEVLKRARNVKVLNTETRPLYQGRKTARELSKYGIKVEHYIDSGARIALKKADVMLIGADAITSEGKVINKIGSEMFAEIADRYGKDVYVCCDSWKFDPDTIYGKETKIEIRKKEEIWKNSPKNVEINNYVFERINNDLITGIISELGIYNPENFIMEVKKRYKEIFS